MEGRDVAARGAKRHMRNGLFTPLMKPQLLALGGRGVSLVLF